jgi:5-methyltetrahydropteroyltriglutamate--homocysteine methyltransferase
MKLSSERMLTTHTGSLPRSPELTAMLVAVDRGETVDGFDEQVTRDVADLVARQRAAGIDVVGDGEAGKVSYVAYITERLDGFGGTGSLPVPPDMAEFPDYASRWSGSLDVKPKACIGPVRYRDLDAVRTDIENLRNALAGGGATEAFITAASPGVISHLIENQYYKTHEEYLWALAEAMAPEYEAIHAGGFVLQLDCPDLPLGQYTFDDFDRLMPIHIEAINEATRNIPPESMRMHVCHGNYEGPHHYDVPLRDLIEPVFKARPAGIMFHSANPRHEHEWRVFDEVKLPEGKVLIPGVIDQTTNYIEHPQVVADRIVRFASRVGPENVIAGVDCGFATAATYQLVDPAIGWAKLAALAEGAELASRELYSG